MEAMTVYSILKGMGQRMSDTH